MNIVLMAGGGGTRLWPLSRVAKPKQFIDLGHGQTLIQMAFKRALSLTEADNIFVATIRSYQQLIGKQLPAVKKENIFYEPEKRDTTAAFTAVVAQLQKRGQGKVPTIFMWTDHVFTRADKFLADLRAVPEIIADNPGYIVIVGHTAITPEIALGYIETEEKVTGRDNVFKVNCFKEKPDLKTAKKFLLAGNYFWNLGYFSFQPDYFMDELLKLNPSLEAPTRGLRQALSKGEDEIERAYKLFPKVSIEYALIEKTRRVLAVTGDYGWLDVGYWTTVEKLLGQKGDYAPRAFHVHVNSDGNFIYNTTAQTVSLLGIKDSVVVVTDDAILISSKEDCGEVKKVIAELESKSKQKVL